LKIFIEKGGFNLGFLDFSVSKPTMEVGLKAISASTRLQPNIIYLSCNKILNDSTVSADGFSCTINGSAVAISSVLKSNMVATQLIITLVQTFSDGDELKLSYSNGRISATDGTLLQNFMNLPVKNNLPLSLAIPGKIEAEAFTVNQGLQLETTSDIGGGQNVGFTNTGDYLEYIIRVNKSAIYNLEVRIACLNQPGAISVQQLNDFGGVINESTLSIPATGGWQTWQTINTEMHLDEGIGTLRVNILQPEFNMNWYKFTEKGLGTEELAGSSFKVFPNPASDDITVIVPPGDTREKVLVFRNLNGIVVKTVIIPSTGKNQPVYVGDLPKGFYLLEMKVTDIIQRLKLIIQ
jgi:endoglucanase